MEIDSLINITPDDGSDESYGGPTNWNGKQFEVFYVQHAPTENVILSLRAADGSEVQKLQKSVSSLGIGSLDDIYRVGLQ
ncbi:MAG: hypothetical protein H3C43_08880 [Leptonema sp. (in: Bacteria)]|nr:hypothetical protein [Leptonema sp. (in: bacteria)]